MRGLQWLWQCGFGWVFEGLGWVELGLCGLGRFGWVNAYLLPPGHNRLSLDGASEVEEALQNWFWSCSHNLSEMCFAQIKFPTGL